MKDSHLLAMALLVGIIGLIGLYFLSESIELEVSALSDVKKLDEFEEVKIQGKIERISNGKGFTKLTISARENVDITVFDEVNLTKGLNVEIVGQINEYKGVKGIVAEKIVAKR